MSACTELRQLDLSGHQSIAVADEPPSFISSSVLFDSAAPANAPQIDTNFISFLAAAQRLKIDFLPISWQPALDTLGSGATAEIRQALVSLQMSFAFKRITHSTEFQDRAYRALTCEVAVLGHPSIQNHPNILRLQGICWDVSIKDEVRPVLVFEKAHHGDLEHFMTSDSGYQLSIKERLSLCRDIVTAIATMHGCHIVHGDIKPQNVLIFNDSSRKYVAKMADFGYSTMVVNDGQTVLLPKSVPWHAPEHHHCNFKFRDAKKTDSYSLGMLCLWLLFQDRFQESFVTAVGAFQAETTSLPESLRIYSWLEQAKQEGKLRSISYDQIQVTAELDGEQKGALKTFFDSTLTHDPSGRSSDLKSIMPLLGRDDASVTLSADLDEISVPPIESVFQVSENLDDFITADYRLRKHIAKCLTEQVSSSPNNKLQKNAAVELAFCYTLGFGVPADEEKALFWLKQSNKQLHELQEKIESSKSRKSRHYKNPLIGSLYSGGYLGGVDYENEFPSVEPLRNIEQEYRKEILDMQRIFNRNDRIIIRLRFILLNVVRAQRDLERSVSLALEFSEDLANDPEYGPKHSETLSSRDILAGILKEQGKFKDSEAIRRRIVEYREETLGKGHLATLISSNNLASTLHAQDKFAETEALHQKLLTGKEKVLGMEHPETIITINNLALVLSAQAKYEVAEAMYKRALEGFKKYFGSKHPDTLTCANNLATVFQHQGNYEAAEDTYQWTLARRKEVFGGLHPSTLSCINNLATVCKSRGKLKMAEDLSRQAVEGREQALGPEHPDTITSVNNLALAIMAQGKYKIAEPILQRALYLSEKTLGGEHLWTLTSVGNLATVLQARGDYEAALELNHRAVEGSKNVLGDNHPTTFTYLSNLATTLNCLGKSNEAGRMLRQVVEGKERELGKDHPSTLTSLSNLASVLQDQGKYEAAEEINQQVLERSEKVLGQEHPRTLMRLNNLAMVLHMEGKYEEAEEKIRLAIERRVKVLGKNHPDTLTSVSILTWVLRARGK